MTIDGYLGDYYDSLAHDLKREGFPYPRPQGEFPREFIEMLLEEFDDPHRDRNVRKCLRQQQRDAESPEEFAEMLLAEVYDELDHIQERIDEGLEDEDGHPICQDCSRAFIDNRQIRDMWYFYWTDPVCRACYSIRESKWERCVRCDHPVEHPAGHRDAPNGRVIYFCYGCNY